jgi:hypothetical protein
MRSLLTIPSRERRSLFQNKSGEKLIPPDATAHLSSNSHLPLTLFLELLFGDGIMGDRLLEDLGIADTCKLCHDEYHLIMENWLKQFGPTLWALYEEKMRLLLYSPTEEVYNHHGAGMRESLKSRRLKDYLENEIHSKRKRFVCCFVASIPGKF